MLFIGRISNVYKIEKVGSGWRTGSRISGMIYAINGFRNMWLNSCKIWAFKYSQTYIKKIQNCTVYKYAPIFSPASVVVKLLAVL